MGFIDRTRAVVKAFSYRIALKTNILSSPGSFIGGGAFTSLGGAISTQSQNFRNRSNIGEITKVDWLSQYYSIFQELQDYRCNDVVEAVLRMYADYMIPSLNRTQDVIILNPELKDSAVNQVKLNRVFNELDVIGEINKHIYDIIYDGQYSIEIKWNADECRYIKRHFVNHGNVVRVDNDSYIPESYLVASANNRIYEVNSTAVLQLGKCSMDLLNDLNPQYFKESQKNAPRGTDDDDTLVADCHLSTCTPLLFHMRHKIKEYLLKDLIIYLLGVKELIMPLILLARVDSNTSIDESNKYALNLENTINKYSDISSILGTNLSITELLDCLLNNVKVLPDYQDEMSNLGTLDLTKILDKLSSLRSEQDSLKESILTSLGMPRSLVSGDSNKWSALRENQRLQNAVRSFIDGIQHGVQTFAMQMYKVLTDEDLKASDVTVKIFNKGDVEYASEVQVLDTLSDVVDKKARLLQSVQDAIDRTEWVDKRSLLDHLIEDMTSALPELDFVKDEDQLAKYIKAKEENGEQGGGGFGGFR